MTSSIKFLPNPFRFLLITEWLMLGSCSSLAVVEAWKGQMIPVQHISILVLLGLLGLRLPLGNLAVKVLYTAFEIGLIFYGTVLGYLHILPTLYLIVVMRSCFLFEALGRWTVASIVFALFLGDQVRYTQRALPETLDDQIHFGMHLTAETLVFGLGIFFILQLTNKLLVERQMRQQLADAHAQLQQYSEKIEDLAAAQERTRIARNIHDSLGHALTSLNIQLQTAAKLWEKEPIQSRSFLTQAQELGKMAMQEVRASISTLREDASDERPLESKIETLVDDFRKGTGLAIDLNTSHCGSVPLPVAKTVYRIVQEALTNIFKHAQAAQVQIQLNNTQEILHLTVKDNGKGFDANKKNCGFGLLGIQERVAAVKGRYQLKTSPGKGCQIEVEIPKSNSSKNTVPLT